MNEELNMENSNNQKFCLKWNNFHNNFISQFEALKEDEDFVDVTLYCYGQCIKAHKVVLSACSPYLKNIFKDHPCKHPIIIFDNLSFNNLEAVIQFIYTGQVYIEQDELSSFLKAAETLQIKGLSESSSNENVLETNIPPVYGNLPQKREAEVDSENKKFKSKRIGRRVSNNGTTGMRENDLCEEQKSTDWHGNGFKSEGCSEGSRLNVNHEDQMLDGEEKGLTALSGDEDDTPGEMKRPHWLDPRSCPLCNRVYSNLSNLRQHIKLIHNPTLVTCKLCYKTFKTDLYLRRHLISFHEINANGNGNQALESYKPIQNQPPDWNPNIKLEQNSFHEMFPSNEMYQVPDYRETLIYSISSRRIHCEVFSEKVRG